jgi:hypothetical protein
MVRVALCYQIVLERYDEGRKPAMATAEQTRVFEDSDRDAAIRAATKWIFELSRQATLYVKSILAVERDGKWLATVTFSEAAN